MIWPRTIALGAGWILLFVAGLASASVLDLVHGDQEPSRPGPSVRRRHHEAAGPRALGDRHSHGKSSGRTVLAKRKTTIPMAYLYSRDAGADRIRGHVLGHKKPGRIAEVGPGRKCDDNGTIAGSNPAMPPYRVGDTIVARGVTHLELTRQDAGGDKAPSHNGGAGNFWCGGVTGNAAATPRFDSGPHLKILTAKPGRGRASTGIVNKSGAGTRWQAAGTSKLGRLEFMPAGGRRMCDGVTLHDLTGNRGMQPGSRRDRVLGRGNRGMAGAGEPARTII